MRRLIAICASSLLATSAIAQDAMMMGAGSPSKGTGGGGGSVSVEQTGTKQYLTGVASSATYNGVTVTSGNGIVFLVAFDLPIGAASPTGLTAVWDNGGSNQSMVLESSRDNAGAGGTVATFCLKAPTAGTKNLAINWATASATAKLFAVALSLTNVNQTTPCPNVQTGAVTATITVTSAPGHMVFNISDIAATVGTPTGTTIFTDNVSGTNIGVYANRDAGAASVVIGSSSSTTFLAAVDVAN